MNDKITKDNFNIVLKDKHPNISLISSYINSKIPIKFKCNTCGNEYELKSRTLLEKGCPYCRGSITHKLSDKEYEQRLYDVTHGEIIKLEPYINMNTKITHRCTIHNIDWEIAPAKILNGRRCRECGKEANHRKRALGLNEFSKRLTEVWGNEIIILDDEYVDTQSKMKFLHRINNNEHVFYSTPAALLQGEGCGVCRNLQICIGYNDLQTTRPDIAILLKNEDDKTKYTEYSKQKVIFKCPNCGLEMLKSINYVCTNGLRCNRCSDGVSFPNKFMYNILYQIKDELDYLQHEYTPEWCQFIIDGKQRKGRYDIYFIYNKKKYIIEMDGGLGHGKKQRNKNADKDHSLEIDFIKEKLATERNICVIRINSDYEHIENRYEFILNQILTSELNNFLPLDKVDFRKACVDSSESNKVLAWELYNQGYSVKFIAEKLNTWTTTIRSYLIEGKKLNITPLYTTQENKYRSNSHEVYCVTTNMYFRSIIDASKYYDIHPSTISKNCRGVSNYGGIYNGVRLQWIYYKNKVA